MVQSSQLKFRILFNHNRYHYSKDQPIDCCNSVKFYISCKLRFCRLQIQNALRMSSTNLVALQAFHGFIIRVIPPEFLKRLSKLTSKFLIVVTANYSRPGLTQTEKFWMCLLRPFFSFQHKSIYRFSETTYAKIKTTYRVTNNRKMHL